MYRNTVAKIRFLEFFSADKNEVLLVKYCLGKKCHTAVALVGHVQVDLLFGQITDFDGKGALVSHCEFLVCCRFFIVLSRGANLTVLLFFCLQQDSLYDNQT